MKNTTQPYIVSFGEVLWDIFPNGERAGGAPFNVAYNTFKMGTDIKMLSKVGNDELGEKLVNQIKEDLKERKLTLQQLTAKKKHKIENTTQSVNMGFILERLAPVLEEFRFNKNDCRSLFDPIDYVIFDGLHKKGKVEKIFFIDIKSGAAKLKKNQKAIKIKVEEKKVEFKLY
jgi:predicted Holliday junction resolvase-like endonuclease